MFCKYYTIHLPVGKKKSVYSTKFKTYKYSIFLQNSIFKISNEKILNS